MGIRSLHRAHPVMIIALLICLLFVPDTARPVAAHASLVSDSTNLMLNVELGERKSTQVVLTNFHEDSLQPALYEAQVSPGSWEASSNELVGPRRVGLPDQAERLDPRLVTMAARAPESQLDFLVFLQDQADLSAAYQIADWDARGRYVYETLLDHAEQSQRDIRTQLTARGLSFTPFWIANALLVHGTVADARDLAGRPEVALVRANHVAALDPIMAGRSDALAEQCSPDDPANPICWNVRMIGADRVWKDFGITGRGVVVSNIDTGVSYMHPALAGQYRGYGATGAYDHNYNWFDPQRIFAAPIDENNHGTHTMGTIIGSGSGSIEQPAIGVAPGARWIAAQGCDGTFCSDLDLIAGAQWLLAPTDMQGQNPRPDLRAMIVNNSWAGPGNDTWYAGYTAAWRAAGMFPIFAAGNAGPFATQECGSIASPADYADVLAVGASDAYDTIAGFSLLGPTINGRVKPDLVAPGTYKSGSQGLLSAVPGDTYAAYQGTSMAAPHVAGVVALLWSANPDLIGDYEATYSILRSAAVPLSDTRCGDAPGVPNNVYGAGRVDAYMAVAQARVDVPWLIVPQSLPAFAPGENFPLQLTLAADRVPGPGIYKARLQIYEKDLTLAPITIDLTMNVIASEPSLQIQGRVLSAETGDPVAATVGVYDSLGVATDATGSYTLTLKPGPYELVVKALSFMSATRQIDLTATRNTEDFELVSDGPRVQAATTAISSGVTFAGKTQATVVVSNTGTLPLYYRVDTPPDQFAVWRSDEPDGPVYNWVDLPPDAPVLDFNEMDFDEAVPLGIAFPHMGNVYTETMVTSKGTLAFAGSYGFGAALAACMPFNDVAFNLIAPFRADLDPSRGGRIRYGTRTDDPAFVLSFEDVLLRNGSTSETYTFQALLFPDGRIVFQYKDLGPLPAVLSVGVQRSPLRYQEIGCGAGTSITNGLALELVPQSPASEWVFGCTSHKILAPGETAHISVAIHWLRPANDRPYRARMRIINNDPLRPVVTVVLDVTMAPAPFEVMTPLISRPQQWYNSATLGSGS